MITPKKLSFAHTTLSTPSSGYFIVSLVHIRISKGNKFIRMSWGTNEQIFSSDVDLNAETPHVRWAYEH